VNVPVLRGGDIGAMDEQSGETEEEEVIGEVVGESELVPE